ncbi:MAG: YceI family protein [Alphaproteobacteria bacterium]
MKMLLCAAFFWASISTQFSALAIEYKVDEAQSALKFSGVHAGNHFNGHFTQWQAHINFDANNLPASHVEVEVNTASAQTGNAMYDGTLPTLDWFDVKNYPQAIYKSQSFSDNGGGKYTAKGSLTLRDKTLPVEFTVQLQFPEQKNTPTKAVLALDIDRLAFGIGGKSDPKAEWVDKNIKLEAIILAHPL